MKYLKKNKFQKQQRNKETRYNQNGTESGSQQTNEKKKTRF